MNAEMREADKHITGMEKWCGLCVCPWNRFVNNDSRVCHEKFWTDTLVYYAHGFKSAFFEHYFPKTTLNFCSNSVLFISISYMELKIWCYTCDKDFWENPDILCKKPISWFFVILSTFFENESLKTQLIPISDNFCRNEVNRNNLFFWKCR